MPQAKIGVIGGSGLYHMENMTEIEEVRIQTPFGDPSDVITIGKVSGVSMAFLPGMDAAIASVRQKCPHVQTSGPSKAWE
ncbi:hypothetical protein KDK_08230 [Dictyobacter kobayashii]|uniref:Uncharacterized protein n=1 Tax=Dictyobacter kobayashii TaxID=2014872 RepID=A0A402AD58_9CHLR|nr:hypothetical protein [Dictyobacter kobayashii]GCE17023.1 hypothetical protein KDK_08230 [Dictyobacter kobayashii]